MIKRFWKLTATQKVSVINTQMFPVVLLNWQY
ncbi:hypothetical protein phiOC_p286 [Ochrobactrum phage vB_OspM_OC]|nr:hypothetical protein phiOC_p286 [Ochrobactrum phage vB_OspM_OC]